MVNRKDVVNILRKILWYIKSDVELQTVTCWYERHEKIDGFYFYSKGRFSKSYQYHATIELDYTYKILELIEDAINNKRKAVRLEISGGMGREKVFIWKGSLKKAKNQIFSMIKQIQVQY